MGYPKKFPVHRNFQFFGIWDIPGISQKKSGTQNFSDFWDMGYPKVYPKKFPVHRKFLFLWDMGYSRDIPSNSRYIEFFPFFWDKGYCRDIPKCQGYMGFSTFSRICNTPITMDIPENILRIYFFFNTIFLSGQVRDIHDIFFSVLHSQSLSRVVQQILFCSVSESYLRINDN